MEKTVKITNCRQFECLVELMERNTDVAKGFFTFGSSKQEFNAAWQGFANQLNSLGPPIRDGTGWQKVWNDFKHKIKKKLGHNKKEISATGGGSNKLHVFSALEESVISLLCLEKISSTSNRTFGLVNNNNTSESPILAASNNHNAPVIGSSPELNTMNDHVMSPSSQEINRDCQILELPATTRRKRSVSLNSQEERKRLFEDHTREKRRQTQCLNEQNNKMDEQTKYMKESARYTRKLFEIKEQKFKMWKEVQLEKRKHRQENMEYKIRALEYKERKLALKENREKHF